MQHVISLLFFFSPHQGVSTQPHHPGNESVMLVIPMHGTLLSIAGHNDFVFQDPGARSTTRI